MSLYSTILVPVAYEPGVTVTRELEVARALAAPGATVTLVHVMEKLPFYAIDYMPKGYREELVGAIRADLSQQAATIAGEDLATQVLVLEGDAGAMLVDHANASGSDCIVLASHRTDRSRIGSTATWIARHAPCAVHLIR